MVGMITVKLNTHLLHAFRNKPDIEFPRRPLLGSSVNRGRDRPIEDHSSLGLVISSLALDVTYSKIRRSPEVGKWASLI
jgi:hypothetical protein